MVINHAEFLAPKDENVKIWRFLDFTKFVALLEDRALFFAGLHSLRDPFEGSLTKIDYEASNTVPKRLQHLNHESYLRSAQHIAAMAHEWRQHVTVNCWHVNEVESEAMWSIYLKSNEGIAVQSTYRRLRQSINDPREVYVGMVEYIDYDTESVMTHLGANMCRPFLRKRKSFQHERELRAFHLDYKGDGLTNGTNIQCDLACLVESVYVAPTAPPWLLKLVERVSAKYGCEFSVLPSRLQDKPLLWQGFPKK